MTIYDQIMFARNTVPFEIGSASLLSIGLNLASPQCVYDLQTPVANVVLVVQFVVPMEATAEQMWIYNGASVGGNIDLGIYDEDLNLLGSTGSIAQSTANGKQSEDLSSNVILTADKYYMAVVFSASTTDGLFGWENKTLTGANTVEGLGGWFHTAGGIPLPDPLIISGDLGVIPHMGVAFTPNNIG